MKRLVAIFIILAAFIGTASATIVVTNSHAWKPFSFIDNTGQPNGILVDYWRLYSEKTGIDVEFKLVDWQQSLDLIKTGEADVHAGLLSLPERQEYMDFGDAITEIDGQIYFHKSLLGTPVDNYVAEHEIGAVAGGAEISYLTDIFPQVKVAEFDNNALMMQAALAGHIKAFIADMQVANYYLYGEGEMNLYYPVRHLYGDEVRYATSHLSKVVIDPSVINDDERIRIVGRWMNQQTYIAYPTFLWPSLALIALISGVAYIYLLRQTVAKQTQELRVANELLQEQAHFDPLTAAMNRRAFLPAAEQLLSNHKSVQLILFDLDHFKQINDHFGHASGDRVLTELAVKLKSLLPKNALFARLGGEEFAIIVANPVNNTHWPELILRAARSINFRQDDHDVTVTLSAGVLNIQTPLPLTELLNMADQLLYKAKQNGRNTWVANT